MDQNPLSSGVHKKHSAPASPRSASPAPASAGAWQLSLSCTRAAAEALDDVAEAVFADRATMPAIVASENDSGRADDWQLDIIFEGMPSQAEIDRILAHLPDCDPSGLKLAPVPDVDWVTRSQAGLKPISAGPFHVRHATAQHQKQGAINFLIPASRAFGTGQHETTRGCLAMLGDLRQSGERFRNVADIGTGTGLLAFAALALWPRAHVLASDIDPVSIEVTAENAAANGMTVGADAGHVMLVAAPGVDHPMITGLAPYDLIIANILAGPLVALAPSLAAQLAPGGSLILAGLLVEQADEVIAAYRALGLRLARRIDNGEWPTLHLRMRRRFGWRRPARWSASINGESNNFGSV